MLKGINDTKRAFIIWTTVFVILFVGLFVAATVWNQGRPEQEQATLTQMLMVYAGALIAACIPIGWVARSRIFNRYFRVPTKEIKIFENKVGVAIWQIIRCFFMFLLNVVVFLVYVALAVVVGPLLNLYMLITGIVFIAKKKI